MVPYFFDRQAQVLRHPRRSVPTSCHDHQDPFVSFLHTEYHLGQLHSPPATASKQVSLLKMPSLVLLFYFLSLISLDINATIFNSRQRFVFKWYQHAHVQPCCGGHFASLLVSIWFVSAGSTKWESECNSLKTKSQVAQRPHYPSYVSAGYIVHTTSLLAWLYLAQWRQGTLGQPSIWSDDNSFLCM